MTKNEPVQDRLQCCRSRRLHHTRCGDHHGIHQRQVMQIMDKVVQQTVRVHAVRAPPCSLMHRPVSRPILLL